MLAVIGILYGAIVAIGQRDIKRLIAYTSVSHFGFIALGIFAMTSQGQSGATLYMVNHGFATGALFILAGFMISRRGSSRIADYGGVQKVAPRAGRAVPDRRPGRALPARPVHLRQRVPGPGRARSPGTRSAAIIATVGIILAAIYILWMYQRTMNGPTAPEVESLPDLRPRELWAVGARWSR